MTGSPKPPDGTADPGVVERVVEVLRRAPAGLLTDIDGTISRIAPSPDAATVEPAMVAMLARLAGRLAVVAALTGRSAADAARMVGVPGLLYVGNHGLERLGPGSGERAPAIDPAAAPFVPVVRETLAAAERAARAAGLRGLLFEDKGLTASIHYRLAPDPAGARATLLPIVQGLADAGGLRLTEGRLVLELRPPVHGNKGTALAALVDDYALAGATFLGDDVTDLDAIAELRRLRDAGRLAGLAVGVVASESPPALREAVDLAVPGVDGVAALLAAVAERLERGISPPADARTGDP